MRIAKNIATFVSLMVALTALYSCGSSSSNTNMSTVSSASAKIVACPATGFTNVAIFNFAFQPVSAAISANGIVKWVNADSTDHTVTSNAPGALDGKFDSGNLAPNATVCVQFMQSGTYQYFCNIHVFMTGDGDRAVKAAPATVIASDDVCYFTVLMNCRGAGLQKTKNAFFPGGGTDEVLPGLLTERVWPSKFLPGHNATTCSSK